MTPDSALREVAAGNVRAEMARRRITQEMLAPILGISQPALSRRLRGQLPFDLDELEALARFLDVDPSRFLASTSADRSSPCSPPSAGSPLGVGKSASGFPGRNVRINRHVTIRKTEDGQTHTEVRWDVERGLAA